MRDLVLACMVLVLVACVAPTSTHSFMARAKPTETLTPAVATTLALVATATPAIAAAEIPDAPAVNLFDLARRYRGVAADPLLAARLYPDEVAGNSYTFWVMDIRAGEQFAVTAELRHVGAHALWYVAEGIEIEQRALERTGRRFDEDIYPLALEIFAPPGFAVEGRLTVLNANLPGLAGYFSSQDLYPASVQHFSNERTMLYMQGNIPIESGIYLGALSHELQHLVHSLLDPDESTWVTEGLSGLASKLSGYDGVPMIYFLEAPHSSLVHWPDAFEETLPHYDASALFMEYLVDRTGGVGQIWRLVVDPSDGMNGVRSYLAAVAPELSVDELLADWAIANYLGISGDPANYVRFPKEMVIDEKFTEPTTYSGSVPQYGSRYLRIDPASPMRVRFKGEIMTPLLPVERTRGNTCWWGNQGDSIDATLTRTLDLADVTTATLRFWQWYQLEEFWDYAYVAVSLDDGEFWHALEGERTVMDDPLRNSWGPGYTGATKGWVRERVDLSAFAGQQVLLRFEYVTDESVNGPGWCVDDISVPEVGFIDDAESDGDWTTNGFVRVPGNRVPQRFAVRVVTGADDQAKVTSLPLDANGEVSFIVTKPSVVVVISMAPKTREPAIFRLEVSSIP